MPGRASSQSALCIHCLLSIGPFAPFALDISEIPQSLFSTFSFSFSSTTFP